MGRPSTACQQPPRHARALRGAPLDSVHGAGEVEQPDPRDERSTAGAEIRASRAQLAGGILGKDHGREGAFRRQLPRLTAQTMTRRHGSGDMHPIDTNSAR